MHFNRTDHRLLTFSAALFLACSQHTFAQSPAGGGQAPASGAPSGAATTGGPTTGNPGNTGSRGPIGNPNYPNNNPNNNGPFSTMSPGMNRPIFLSGKVMFDDGTPTNSEIRIERVCGGNPRLEAHTDSKGRFSFQLGQNMMVDTDASNASIGGFPGRPNGQMSPMGGGGLGGNSSTNLWNCELRASYPGYRSDTVELSTRRSMDDPEVGTIVLHRLGNVQGTTLSVTTALAPKQAQKDYEKGLQLAQKGKFEEAEKKLSSATELYPKFAVAWFALGQVQQKTGRIDDARKAFEQSAAADTKYLSPYDQLALLSAQSGKWEDAAKYSKQVISMNQYEFPSSFWYNALANYNLKKPDEAEKSVQSLLKIDTKHRFVEAENLMAQLNLDKGNYPEAAVHLKSYLALAPNAKNADSLKQILAKLEQTNAQAKK